MTNLDLNAYDVEEMSVAEMREIDGGIPLIIHAIPLILYIIVCKILRLC